jgi:putative ABC transport system ATP-binding protein
VGKLTQTSGLAAPSYQGFIFQGYNLLNRTSALENVELPLLYRGAPARERRDRAMEALKTSVLWVGSPTRGRALRRPAAAGCHCPRHCHRPSVLLAEANMHQIPAAGDNGCGHLNRELRDHIVVDYPQPDMACLCEAGIHFLDGWSCRKEGKQKRDEREVRGMLWNTFCYRCGRSGAMS